jgi:hypothetical protein
MNKSETLNLSIGDDVADSRLSNDAYSGRVELQGKSVRIKVSKTARHAISAHHTPILAQLELYFSYLVQKQVHFREVADTDLAASAYARVLPGLYAAFRAVTTGKEAGTVCPRLDQD